MNTTSMNALKEPAIMVELALIELMAMNVNAGQDMWDHGVKEMSTSVSQSPVILWAHWTVSS